MDNYTTEAATILTSMINTAMASAVAGQPACTKATTSYASNPYVTDAGVVKAHILVTQIGGLDTFYTNDGEPISFNTAVELIRSRVKRVIEG